MKLSKFRITNFRSIDDSGWIESDNIVSFCGENESGKTNIFLALLKFREVGKYGVTDQNSRKMTPDINFLNPNEDIPLGREEEIISKLSETVFCRVVYELISGELNAALKRIWDEFIPLKHIGVSRTYDGGFVVNEFEGFPKNKRSDAYKLLLSVLPVFDYYQEFSECGTEIDFLALANKIAVTDKHKLFTPREYMFYNLLTCLDIWENNLVKSTIEAYGKFDTEISKKFDFAFILKKVPLLRARLDKGFAKLTAEFFKWWNDDNIVITYEPNKMGIIIMIHENDRKFTLASRSTGFKRFFSMFLAFSILHKNAFRKTILLFDEADATLHPITQKKLEHFFRSLSERVQIMYNTHTPYMLSVSNLDKAKVVHKDEHGKTHIGNSLKMEKDRSNEYSLFAPHASLALSVAEKQLKGCFPVVVVEENDEIYLSLVRNFLYAEGMLKCPYNLLVFAAGDNGARAVSDIFSSMDGTPPIILLEDSVKGKQREDLLKNSIYKNYPDKIIKLSTVDNSILLFEDLFPTEYLVLASKQYLMHILKKEIVFDIKKSYLEQVKQASKDLNINLPVNFRIEVAKRCKIGLMRNFDQTHFTLKTLNAWSKIWNKIILG